MRCDQVIPIHAASLNTLQCSLFLRYRLCIWRDLKFCSAHSLTLDSSLAPFFPPYWLVFSPQTYPVPCHTWASTRTSLVPALNSSLLLLILTVSTKNPFLEGASCPWLLYYHLFLLLIIYSMGSGTVYLPWHVVPPPLLGYHIGIVSGGRRVSQSFMD